MVPLIEPILNPIWVLIFIGEKPTKWALLGGTVVICSLIIHSRITMSQRTSSQYIDVLADKREK